jgi:hypothetical protein
MFLTLSKQIISRFFVATLLRMTLRRPAQAYNSKLSKEHKTVLVSLSHLQMAVESGATSVSLTTKLLQGYGRICDGEFRR